LKESKKLVHLIHLCLLNSSDNARNLYKQQKITTQYKTIENWANGQKREILSSDQHVLYSRKGCLVIYWPISCWCFWHDI